MMKRCLIIDDEELARLLIEQYVNKIPSLEVVGKCRNVLEAMEIMANEHIDLLFLDIQMPKMSGIDFLKSASSKPHVIITTAYPDYALEGFNLNVIDYLLKPYGFERFFQAITKFNQIKQPLSQLKDQNQKVKSKNENSEYILVNSEHKIYRLHYQDILYIQSMREYIAFHTADKKRILSLTSLKKLEQELPHPAFIRVHKSYIVASNKIQLLDGKFLDLGDNRIPIGAMYRDDVINCIFKNTNEK